MYYYGTCGGSRTHTILRSKRNASAKLGYTGIFLWSLLLDLHQPYVAYETTAKLPSHKERIMVAGHGVAP